MENLVFSSGYGYPRTYLRAFLKSISLNMNTADVILFYHDTSEQSVNHLRNLCPTVRVVRPSDHLFRRAISILPRGRIRTSRLIHQLSQNLDSNLNQQHSPLFTATYHPALARYFWVSNYCDSTDIRQYKKLMLCDSRDVVVQSNAFDKIDDMSFISGIEEKRIGECPINQAWISNCYGEDVLAALSNESIVCSGVSLGPREIVLEYVRSMVKEMKRIGKRLAGIGGNDQPIHNYLIRTHTLNFPVHVTNGRDGIIGTLNYYDRKRLVIDDADRISVENGVTPSIIHQYDRFQELCEHCSRIY